MCSMISVKHVQTQEGKKVFKIRFNVNSTYKTNSDHQVCPCLGKKNNFPISITCSLNRNHLGICPCNLIEVCIEQSLFVIWTMEYKTSNWSSANSEYQVNSVCL